MNQTTQNTSRKFKAITAVKGILAAISVSLILFMLSIVCLGSSYGGFGGTLTTFSINIQEQLGIFANHTISHALDGLIPVEKIYVLNDSDIVAPEPDQAAFGTTDDPTTLQWFINKAYHRLNGEDLFFSTETPLMKDTSVRYYLDDTIAAVTWKEVHHSGAYTFSEIKINHPSQFRRFLADGKYGSDKQYLTSQMATSVNAVVASAGDFYKYRHKGLVVYNGKVERFNGTFLDSCFIDDKGNLLFSKAGELKSQEDLEQYINENNVRFSLCFGPILIEEGESKVPYSYPLGEISQNYSRSAICQLGDLHYLLVTANDEGPYTRFPSLYLFAETLIKRGVEHAYTLDGGQTATIVMNDQVINHVSYGAERYISDIIYFATAIPETE